MKDEFIRDISSLDLSKRINIDKPYDYNSCANMKKTTPARICVGRAGTRYKTETLLRFRADHAVAMDAVWSEIDMKPLQELNFFKIQTLVRNKEEYITRPDLGGQFSEETINLIKGSCVKEPDVQIIVADGLSSPAIAENVKDIYSIIIDGLGAKKCNIGTPIFIKYGRVSVVEKISQALDAKVTILLIGERPGLATGESMKCYMAYEAGVENSESQINVISNIHRNGTPPVEAGAYIVHIAETMLKEQRVVLN